MEIITYSHACCNLCSFFAFITVDYSCFRGKTQTLADICVWPHTRLQSQFDSDEMCMLKEQMFKPVRCCFLLIALVVALWISKRLKISEPIFKPSAWHHITLDTGTQVHLRHWLSVYSKFNQLFFHNFDCKNCLTESQ